jgi:hypothetical protein
VPQVQVPLELRDLQVPQDRLVPQDHKALQDPKVPQVRVQLDHKDHKDHKVK